MLAIYRELGLLSLALHVMHVTGNMAQIGTLSAPTLPPFIPDLNFQGGCPWGSEQADQVDPDDVPDTGVTRRYHFNATRNNLAPDGVNRTMILINGEFPGPTIEANWGDMIEVTLTNNIAYPAEGTTIHWHGIRQRGTPWMDGVPSTTQCPIAPGSSFTYTFRADTYGSSFWHSHYGAQYSAGIWGGIVIYGPKYLEYDVDLGPVVLSDWYHADYLDIVQSVVGSPAPITQAISNNNLINGRMPFDCKNPTIRMFNLSCTTDTQYSKFRFTTGKTHLLRLMNAGSQGVQRFTIDGMTMTVVANDFVPIVPYNTTMLTIGIGQRADVLVHATGQPNDAIWMRSDVSKTCSASSQPHAMAAIYYEQANVNVLPNTTATLYNDSWCGNEALNLTTPLYALNPPATPGTVQRMDMAFALNATGSRVWYVNNQTFRADYEHPIILLAAAGNTTYPNPDWSVYNIGNTPSVRIVLYGQANGLGGQHPMHLHGHNFWVVAEGIGEWDGIANLVNPMRRDTYILQPGDSKGRPGYIVIDFLADNPGVWPLHCHLAWHVSAGLSVNILENPDAIVDMKIPRENYQTCKEWANYKGVDLVPEIDSGI